MGNNCNLLKRYDGTRVLILEGYARQSLSLAKAFCELGCDVSAYCSSKLDVSYASRYVNHKILGICGPDRPEETENNITSLVESGNYDVIVPTTDLSAGILARNKERLMKYAKIASNYLAVYDLAQDKSKTMQICMKKEIPCPITLINTETTEEIQNSHLKYPLVVKPRVSYGAIGFHRFDTHEQLASFFAEGSGHNNIDDYVIQEYIPQTDIQYECAMFMDNYSQVKTALVFSKNRWFPIEGGSSTFNITVDRPDIIESCTKLLKAINWRGAADIDLIQDPRDNTAKIMEINPRVSGSVKICFDAGVDQARQMLELAFGEPITKYEKYEVGRRLRCSQTDLLWFLKSPNRFKSKPSWFNCHNTKDQIFSWADPLPWFTFSLHGVLNYRREMRKRK